MKRASNTEKYNEITQEQMRDGVVENAPDQTKGKEFYIHKPVIRENAETTKMRIVYDASAKEKEKECLPSTTVSIQDHPYRIYFGVFWSEEDFVLFPSLGICRRPFCKSESGRMIEIHCDSTGDPKNKLNFRRSDSHELYSGWHLRRSSARRRSYRAPSGKLGRSQTRSRTRNTKDTPQMLKRKN